MIGRAALSGEVGRAPPGRGRCHASAGKEGETAANKSGVSMRILVLILLAASLAGCGGPAARYAAHEVPVDALSLIHI